MLLFCATLAAAIFALIATDVMDSIKSDAQVDVWSGLFNRRNRARSMRRRGKPTAHRLIILSDLDHFKSTRAPWPHRLSVEYDKIRNQQLTSINNSLAHCNGSNRSSIRPCRDARRILRSKPGG